MFVLSTGDNFYESMLHCPLAALAKVFPARTQGSSRALRMRHAACYQLCFDLLGNLKARTTMALRCAGGLTSADDDQFKTSFTDVYSDESLQVCLVAKIMRDRGSDL